MRNAPAMERAGFTLVETLVALLVFGIITAGALGFYMTQNRAFAAGSDRTIATQNLLYAASAFSRDVAAAGTNLGPGQPFLVHAGPDVIAFNADYLSNVVDPFAVYHDPDAPSGAVIAATTAQRFTIPNSAISYPDTTYPGAGAAVSSAETIIFFFAADTSTARADDFALWRQVNAGTPELIARDLVAVDRAPFFSYVRVLPSVAGVSQVGEVPAGSLPLRHAVPVHGAPEDTGRASVIDSVRAVRMTFGSVTPRDSAGSAEVSRVLVWMPNANLATPRSCGGEPLFGRTLNVRHVMQGGQPAVELTWAAATDESGGEEDVMRYVIYRRASGEPRSDEAYQSIPAGNASYVFTDRAVQPGQSWTYEVAAQDCTPSLSSRAGASITIPGAP